MNIEQEKQAIRILRNFEPETEPYYLCYSGGKDSDAIKLLAQLAGVKYEAEHCLTTVDAPETVQYIKQQSDVHIALARDRDGKHKTMWSLIVDKLFPPTRVVRYCCSELKEWGGRYRRKITGVRKAESVRRKQNSELVKIVGKPKTVQKEAERIGADYTVAKQGGLLLNNDNDESRLLVEHCYRTTSTMINPIVDWSTEDVWEFLHHYGCKSNPLYECGYSRIGCIGCPMAGKHRYEEFELYPKYKAAYLMAFSKMLKVATEKRTEYKRTWKTGEDVFRWWMGEAPNQITFDDIYDEIGIDLTID